MTSSKYQPGIHVFNNCFLYENINFKELANYFDVKFETLQEESWVKFWKSKGEEIILKEWNFKYADYLVNENDKKETIENSDEYLEVKEDNSIVPDSDSHLNVDNTAEWERLWQQHSQDLYLENYTLFSSIFYNYICDLKRSLQEDINVLLEDKTNEDVKYEYENLAEDLEQLKLLGLPTKFGGRCRGTNRKSKQKELICYFSSDEDIDEMDSADDEKLNNDNGKENNSATALHQVQMKGIKKKKKNRKLRKIPEFLLEEKNMLKYWRKRFSLFSLYDDGIRLDKESWYSVTPEKIAIHLAERLVCDVLIDGFCGCGGNAIQFAKTCQRVIAIDIDRTKLEMAKHNANIYGVAHKIDFIVGDFLQLSDSGKLQGDIVFLSPPWGGPKYKNQEGYDIEESLIPVGATELMEKAHRISENVAMYLPRNSNMQQIIKLAGVGNRCEVEHNYLDTRLVAITALYGEGILSKTKVE